MDYSGIRGKWKEILNIKCFLRKNLKVNNMNAKTASELTVLGTVRVATKIRTKAINWFRASCEEHKSFKVTIPEFIHSETEAILELFQVETGVIKMP